MSTAKYEITNKAVLAWCKDLHEQGFDLTMTWDGGNDSGFVEFIVDKSDKTDQDLEYIEYLENQCYDELDYGSWAGEFHAQGEASFDPEQNAFVGTDYYAEDTDIKLDCNIRLAVPKDVWFDRLEVHIEDYDINVSSDLVIINGFKSSGHDAAVINLNNSIHDQVDDIISGIENYRSMWTDITVDYSEFTPEGDEMVHYIYSLEVGTEDATEKGIHISLENN
jgi:hypothetical protein